MPSSEGDIIISGQHKTVNGELFILENEQKSLEKNKNAKVLKRMCQKDETTLSIIAGKRLSEMENTPGAKAQFAHLVESYKYTNIAYRECIAYI